MTTTYFGDQFIDAQLAAVSNSRITVSGTRRPVVFDRFHMDVLEHTDGSAGQNARIARAEIRTTAFPDIKQGDEVDIDGIRYTVWKRSELGDGGTTELLLKVVEP